MTTDYRQVCLYCQEIRAFHLSQGTAAPATLEQSEAEVRLYARKAILDTTGTNCSNLGRRNYALSTYPELKIQIMPNTIQHSHSWWHGVHHGV